MSSINITSPGIYLYGNKTTMDCMDVNDYRRLRLRQIIDENHGGIIANMVKNVEWSHSLISRWAGERIKNPKPIGTKVAREIEKIYDRPTGWMDTPPEPRKPVKQHRNILDVAVLDVAASMGHGLIQPDGETIIDHLRLSAHWVRDNLIISNPVNLAVVTGFGDSMTPTFHDGDILLVDRGVTSIKIDAVYVMSFRNELYIKRIQRKMDGQYAIISDNKVYDSIGLSDKDMQHLEILGRVVWAWNGRKL